MAKNPDPRITPYLLYEDVGAALQWLSSAFGLKPYGDVYKDDGGIINHAAMKLGDGVIMMGHPGPDYRNPHKLGGVTQNLYVRVKGVDEHFARAREAGAKILQEPTDMFYGHRRYGAEDPEGHVWYFAQPVKSKKKKSKKEKKNGKR